MRNAFWFYLGFMGVVGVSVFAFATPPLRRASSCTNQVEIYSDTPITSLEAMQILNYVEDDCMRELLAGCAILIRKNYDDTVDFSCISYFTLSPEERDL